MKRSFCVFITCLGLYSSIAQQSRIDSIHQRATLSTQDIELAERYAALFYSHYNIGHVDSSEYYSRVLTNLSRQINYPLGELKAKLPYTNELDNIPKALEASFECLDLGRKSEDTIGIINSLFALNVLYRHAEQYEKSIVFGKQLLALATAFNDSN